MGPPMSVIEAGWRGIVVGRHDGGGGERRNGGLAHGDDVRVRAEELYELDDVVDEVVEVEGAGEGRHVARSRPSR